MSISSFILLCVLIAFGAAYHAWVRRRLRRFYDRPCAGRAWRRRFPEATSGDIRAFLVLFVDAFLLKRRACLAFRPDDQLLDIYRALYTLEGSPDAMEFETFGMELEEKYGVVLNNFWHTGLTLGEVFQRAYPPH